MKLTTSHLLMAGAGLIFASQGENVRGSIDKGNQIRTQQSTFHERVRENRTKTRNAQKLSKVALDRYAAGCFRVQRDGRDEPLLEGVLVLNSAKAKETMRPGAFICNGLGDTAVVGEDGKATDIARVATTDEEEFQAVLEKR